MYLYNTTQKSSRILGNTYILFLLIFLLLLSSTVQSNAQENTNLQEITTQEFFLLHKRNDVIILDVRTGEEYTQGHIPSAQWLNIEDIHFPLSLDTLDKDKVYILYDDTGKRSLFVTHAMLDAGFTTVYYAKEGIRGWKNAGHRLSRGTCN